MTVLPVFIAGVKEKKLHSSFKKRGEYQLFHKDIQQLQQSWA